MIDLIRKTRKELGYSNNYNDLKDKVDEEMKELRSALFGRDPQNLRDEIADVVISLVGYCDCLGYDLNHLIIEQFNKVKSRVYR